MGDNAIDLGVPLASILVLAVYDPQNNIANLLLLIHLLAAICAFGPLFFYPRLQRAGEMTTVASLHMRLVFPALVVLWIAGMGIAGVYEFDLAKMYWVSITIVLWLVALLVSWFLIRPAVNDTSDDARKKMAAGIGVTHIILIAALWLMIFKPFGESMYVIKS